jgi:hypothetical protein
MQSSTISPTISGNTISDCDYGIYIYANGVYDNDVPYTATASPAISGNNISDWTKSGIYVLAYADDLSTAHPSISNNTFSNVSILANQALTFDGNGWGTYSSNTFTPGNQLCIGLEGSLNEDRTWSKIPDVPYMLTNDFYISAGATVTVPNGTIVLADSYSHHLYVRGTLNANGAVFTSVRDPDYGID